MTKTGNAVNAWCKKLMGQNAQAADKWKRVKPQLKLLEATIKKYRKDLEKWFPHKTLPIHQDKLKKLLGSKGSECDSILQNLINALHSRELNLDMDFRFLPSHAAVLMHIGLHIGDGEKYGGEEKSQYYGGITGQKGFCASLPLSRKEITAAVRDLERWHVLRREARAWTKGGQSDSPHDVYCLLDPETGRKVINWAGDTRTDMKGNPMSKGSSGPDSGDLA
jgi:hypothetical protein